MRIKFFAACILISTFALAETLTGTAKSKNGAIAYFEKHKVEKDDLGLNKSIRVEYSMADGTVFATMTSEFSKNKNVPDTIFVDKRFESKSIMRIVNGSVEFEDFKNDISVSKKKIPLEDKMVASQGFDNFIKSNAAKLDRQPVEFKFGVLEKQDFYSLTGYKKASDSAQDIQFGIRASNWFLRLFTEELLVVYDSKNMSLKSFKGRSNILDEFGNSQDVIISYQWLDRP